MSESGTRRRSVELSEPRLETGSLDEEEWTLVREFVEDENGYVHPRYEAKFVEEVSGEYLEDDLVLLKETSGTGGRERMYHVPEAVFRKVVSGLR